MRLCFALIVLLAGQSAAAQTSYKWTGGASGSWQTPTNWTPQGVPGAADGAYFETSADVTLAADTRVNGLSATGIRSIGSPFPPLPTFPIVTVSSSTYRFVSVGSASASRGTLTITARVDTCGSVSSEGSSSNNPGSQATLQNVGGVGSISGGGRGVSVSGSPLRVGTVVVSAGNVSSGGGPTLIGGAVLSVGDVTMSGSLRDGSGRLVVTSTPVPGGTRFGTFTFSSSLTPSLGTVDLQVDDAVIGRIANPLQGPTGTSSIVSFSLRNADVAEIVATGTGFVGIGIGGTLRLGRAAGDTAPGAGSLSFGTATPGAALVFGTGTSASAPAQISRPMILGTGLNLRIDGPTLVTGGGGRFQLGGGVFTVSPGARLRLESPLFEIAGTGTFGVDGELSVAPPGNNPMAPRAVTVSVPARLAGSLDIDLTTVTPGDASRISFAALAAGGALAFTYPGVAAYPLGTTFTPFTYTGLTGAFAPVTFPPLQGNTAWAFALEPTRARLAVVLGQAPGPVNDEVATDEDVPVSFDPASNDTSTSGGPLTTVAIGASSLGTTSLDSGTVTFTPTSNVSGEETIPYTVRGSSGLQSTGSVHLVVRPVNDAPVAVDDPAATQEAALVQIDVLANDTDVDGPALSIAAVETPSVGNAFRSEGKILYAPPVGFIGTVTFGYTVTDGSLSDQGQVTVVVRPFTAGGPLPERVVVSAPSPNPSAGAVSVTVSLPQAARVAVDLFDALGRRIPSAVPGEFSAGVHAVVLGASLAPGTYFYQVRVAGEPQGVGGRFTVVR